MTKKKRGEVNFANKIAKSDRYGRKLFDFAELAQSDALLQIAHVANQWFLTKRAGRVQEYTATVGNLHILAKVLISNRDYLAANRIEFKCMVAPLFKTNQYIQITWLNVATLRINQK